MARNEQSQELSHPPIETQSEGVSSFCDRVSLPSRAQKHHAATSLNLALEDRGRAFRSKLYIFVRRLPVFA